MRLTDELYQALLEHWPVARLATLTADGQPHCVPVVFCGVDGAVYSPVDDKRKRHPRLKRFANVAAHAQASLLLDHYSDDWEQLWWVRIEGIAERFEPPADTAKRIAEELLRKYPQYDGADFSFDGDVFLRLQPGRTTAWAQAGSPAAIRRALGG